MPALREAVAAVLLAGVALVAAEDLLVEELVDLPVVVVVLRLV